MKINKKYPREKVATKVLLRADDNIMQAQFQMKLTNGKAHDYLVKARLELDKVVKLLEAKTLQTKEE